MSGMAGGIPCLDAIKDAIIATDRLFPEILCPATREQSR